jgi:hypothetical protein
MRIVVTTIAIAAVFAAALVFGGEVLGVWEAADPPPPSAYKPFTSPHDKANDQAEEDEEKKQENSNGSAPAAADTSIKVSPAKQRWLGNVNALCRRAYKDMNDLMADRGQPRTLEEAEAMLIELQRLNLRYNARFAALEPVKGDRKEFAALLALFDKDERLIDVLLTTLRERDLGALAELEARLTTLGQKEMDILVGLGASDCDFGYTGPSY